MSSSSNSGSQAGRPVAVSELTAEELQSLVRGFANLLGPERPPAPRPTTTARTAR